MADVSSSSSYSELTAFSGRYRVLGLSNDIFNTNDLLEAEIAAIDAEIKPTENKKANLQNELAIWEEYGTKLNTFNTAMKNIAGTQFNSRITTYSSEGNFSLEPSADAVVGKYEITVNQLAQSHQIASDKVDSIDLPLTKEGLIKINGKELDIESNMSLRDVVLAINSGSYGVSAAIISNRLVITSKETGTDSKVEIEDSSNGVLKELGILGEQGEIKNTLVEAKNAEYTINGIAGESQSNVVSDGLDGSVLTLKKVTNGSVSAEITSDENKMVDKVKQFVTAFNTMVDNHAYYSGEGMMLQGQSTALNIRMALSQMGNFTAQDGTKLYEVGVSLDKNGKLVLDEEKLKSVYKDNPEKVQNSIFGENGAAGYMEQKMERFVGNDGTNGRPRVEGTLTQKIAGLGTTIADLTKQIQKFDDLYAYRTESLYTKYAEFESKMSNLNFQLTYMEAQMEALNGNKD